MATIKDILPPENVPVMGDNGADASKTPETPQLKVLPVKEISGTELVEITLPAPGKGSRTLDDYRKLDWSKPASQLAKECGVSRQRISQIKKELENKPDTQAVNPTFDDITAPPENETVTGNGAGGDIESEPNIAKAAIDYKLLAETTFDMGTGLLCMTIGPEWHPRILKQGDVEINERVAVVDALQKYFTAKQVQDLPPGLMLTFILASYAAPRFGVDNTKTKMQRAYLWGKSKLASIFKRKNRSELSIVKKQD